MRRILLILSVLGIVAVAGFIFRDRFLPQVATLKEGAVGALANIPQVTPVVIEDEQPLATVSLPFVMVPPDAVTRSAQPDKTQATLMLPIGYPDIFSAYAAETSGGYSPVIPAPSGWKAVNTEGQDGNTTLLISPDGKKRPGEPYVSYTEIPACISCFFDAAAVYFPDASAAAKMQNLQVAPQIPVGLMTETIEPGVVSYAYYSAENALEVYGIVFVRQHDDQLTPPFMRLEVGVQEGGKDVARLLIRYYYRTYIDDSVPRP